VQTDGEWVVEVISKLLDNACKFTEPEGRVMIQAQVNGRNRLEIIVADTGRGIEPDRLEVVFDRFYQEEGALRRSAGGTGLGLAICRQIITGLGGEIWAESAGKDQGTQFHFTVPIAPGADDVKKPKSTRKLKGAA
jgi:signal transduction histidine kinase